MCTFPVHFLHSREISLIQYYWQIKTKARYKHTRNNRELLFFWEVSLNERELVAGVERAKESSKAALEAPWPPNSPAVNQHSRPSPGARFPPTLGGGNHRREKKKRTQPNRCRKLQVSLPLCAYMKQFFAHLWILLTWHAYVCLRICVPCRSLSGNEKQHLYLCLCVLLKCVWGRFVRQLAPEGEESCLHIDEPATLPICPWTPHKHHSSGPDLFKASQNI